MSITPLRSDFASSNQTLYLPYGRLCSARTRTGSSAIRWSSLEAVWLYNSLQQDMCRLAFFPFWSWCAGNQVCVGVIE
jgi:hypothetical protein